MTDSPIPSSPANLPDHTPAPTEPSALQTPPIQPRSKKSLLARLTPWVFWSRVSYELIALLILAGWLAWDRYRLLLQFLSKYTDEDQAIQWYAAKEFLHGRLHEPCFFGQAYNSNLEAYLAAPLIYFQTPCQWAVPIITVILGLLPFVLLAAVAFRRRQSLVAALALFIPIALSTRYGIITGMPRGFVTGLALSIIPALLFLPPFPRKPKIKKLKTSNPESPAPPPEPPPQSPPITIPQPPLRERLPLILRRHLPSILRHIATAIIILFAINLSPHSAIPALLVAFAALLTFFRESPIRRSWPKTRYFVAAFFAVFAVTINPNCAVLLAAVAFYGLLTTFREWRFWLFTPLGLLAAAPYPWLIYKFYYVWHPDYAIYPFADRAQHYGWSWDKFHYFLKYLANDAFHDLLPKALETWFKTYFQTLHTRFPNFLTTWAMHNPAPSALCLFFAAAIILLACRLKPYAILAALAGIALVIISFADGRVADGNTSVSFPYARMYLAVPVLFLWLLMLVNPPKPKRLPKAIPPKLWKKILILSLKTSAALVTLIAITWLTRRGVADAKAKNIALPVEAREAYLDSRIANLVPVKEALFITDAIQKFANEYHVSFVLVDADRNGKKWAYAIPALTTCESLFPSSERRTWRLVQESYPRYDKILVLGNVRTRNRQFSSTSLSYDPPITLVSLNGHSVIDYCKDNRIGVRPFDRPPPTPAPPTAPKPPRPAPKPPIHSTPPAPPAPATRPTIFDFN